MSRAIAKRIRKAGGGMVGLVGVQSNQFPRALDLGREFRALGVPVVIGGFHVSGCLAMLPKIPPEMQEALDLGIHLFAGEAEGRMADVLRDVADGTAKPIYNYLDDMPEMASAVPPILPSNWSGCVLTAIFELRCRPRLPVPVQLLHHHQRAGAQIALPLRRRRRGDRARQCRAGHHALLRHRRQFRPQPQLGSRSSTA